ncbi:MAG: peptidase domain-containing ABC transporter [Runella sp.]
MNSSQIKEIVAQLASAMGQPIVPGRNKAELVDQSINYTVADIHHYLDDLSRYARFNDLTTIVHDMPIHEFDSFLAHNDYPILYFEKIGEDFIPVIYGKDYKGKPIYWSTEPTLFGSKIPQNPLTFKDHPEVAKNGRVIYITTFPMEPLVSSSESLHNSEEKPFSPAKRLFQLLTNESKDIGYIYFYAIVVGLVSLILPLGVSSIFGLVASGMVFSSVYVLMGLVLLGLIASGVLQIIQVTLVEVLQQRIFAKAAFEFTYRLPRLKYEGFSQSNPVELMNRFFDVLTIQKALPKFLIDITAATLQILFGLLLLSFYHPFFIAFSIVIIAAFLGIVRLNGAKGLETSIKESKFKYRVVAWLEDMANTLFSFKAVGNTPLPIQKMDVLVTNYLTYRQKHFKILKGFYYYALGFKVLVIGGLLILGTFLLIDRQLTLGQFVASELIIVLLTAAVEKLFMSIDIVFDLLTAVDKLGQVTDLPLEREGGFKFASEQCKNGIEIKIRNLSYGYPEVKKRALNNVSTHIRQGERICLTGQNGSGKHTLLKVLSGILNDYQGSAIYNGIPIRDLDLTSLRSYIGVNFPNEEIFDGTILENLTMGRSGITLEHVQLALDRTKLTEEIAALPDGLNTPIVSGGRRFSQSFTTKLAIARCLLLKPKLLLFTDTLQNLERAERLRFIELLTDPTNQWTLIALSNDPAFMGACDRVLVMDEGQIVAEGDYKSVLKHVAMFEN